MDASHPVCRAAQPSDLLERHSLIFEVTKSEGVPQAVKDFAEGCTFRGEAPRQ
jgi:hypothetical protein